MDTSSFVAAWREKYPIDVFPSFWEQLDLWAQESRLVSPDEVLRELEKREDGLWAWARQRAYLFRPLDSDVEEQLKIILSRYPRLVDENEDKPNADPFVIALALVVGAVVVTEERRSNRARPPIPNVCDAMNVECIDVLGLIREMKLRF